jgi:hypothetical protein
MLDKAKPYGMIEDFVTGRRVPNIGAEENRQRVERFLVEKGGYSKEDIEVDADVRLTVAGEEYHSNVDLVVRLQGKRFMVLRCVPGALVSRQRETLAAARVLDAYQIPLAVVSDGKNAHVLDTITGELLGEGMDAIPPKVDAVARMKTIESQPFPEDKLEREKIVFRSYDEMNINVQRKLRHE